MKNKLNTQKLTAAKAQPTAAKEVKKVLKVSAPIKAVDNEAQTMRVTFKQIGTTKKGDAVNNSIVFETTSTENVAKQALGHFYAIVSKYKRSNSALFNFALPIFLVVEKEGQTINFEDLLHNEYIGLTKGLKLQWTKEGLLRFSAKVRIAIEAVIEDRNALIDDEFSGIQF
jgi:hypothetical protein